MRRKKAETEGPGQLVTFLIVLAILLIVAIIISVLSGKGDIIWAGITNMFRFG